MYRNHAIDKIELHTGLDVDRDAVRDELAACFPNAEVIFDVEYTGWSHNKPLLAAAWSGKWYQADHDGPVYQAIHQIIEGNAE